jgi:hypothetical protein
LSDAFTDTKIVTESHISVLNVSALIDRNTLEVLYKENMEGQSVPKIKIYEKKKSRIIQLV